MKFSIVPRGDTWVATIWGHPTGPIQARGNSRYRAIKHLREKVRSERDFFEEVCRFIEDLYNREVVALKASKCQFCNDTGLTCAHSWRPITECDQTHVSSIDGNYKALKHAACDDHECPCGIEYDPNRED